LIATKKRIRKVKIKKKIFSTWFMLYFTKINRPIEILFGGAGSGKSVHSAMKDARRLVFDNKNILVVRKRYNSLKDSYYSELKKAIAVLGLSHEVSCTTTPLQITCKANGKVILFRGLDDVEKIKSITPPNGPIDHITIEEATEVKEADLGQLQFRMRGGGNRVTDEQLIAMNEMIDNGMVKVDILEALDLGSEEEMRANQKTLTLLFNPVNKQHWIFKRFFKKWVEDDQQHKIYEDEDLYINKSTHRDNNFLTLDDHIRYESYKTINPYLYDVYCCGKWGVLGDLVFTNFQIKDLSKVMQNVGVCDHGIDWGGGGKSAHAYSKVYNDVPRSGLGGNLYIIGECGGVKQKTKDFAKQILPFYSAEQTIWADSNNPLLVDDMNEILEDVYGIQRSYVMMAHKGRVSGRNFLAKKLTIDYINCQTTYIDYRMINHIAAFTSSVYARDAKTDEVLEEIERNEYDHWLYSAMYSQVHRAISVGSVHAY